MLARTSCSPTTSNRREPDFLKADIGKRAQVEQLDVLDGASVAEIIRRHGVEGVVYLAVPALAGVSPADEFQTNTAGLPERAGGQPRRGRASADRHQLGGDLRQRRRAALARRRECLDALDQSDRGLQESPRSARAVLRPAHGSGRGHAARGRASSVRCTTRCPTCPAAWCTRRRTASRPTSAGMRVGPPKADDGGDACYVKDCALRHPARALGADSSSTASTTSATARPRATRPGRAPSARSCPSSGRPAAGGDADNRYMDLSRTTAELGYTPKIGVERGLAEYVAWLRTHPN